MPGCVLRAAGVDFSVDEFLKESTFTAHVVYHKGEPKGSRGKVYEESGINIIVSEASGDDLAQQIVDAIEFLERNSQELLRLHNYLGGQASRLDFGVWQKDDFGHFYYFPPNLLQSAAALGIGIELSVYIIKENET